MFCSITQERMCHLPILLLLLCRDKGGKVCSLLFHEEEDEAAAAAGATPSFSWEGALPSLGLGRDISLSLSLFALKGSYNNKGILEKGKKCMCSTSTCVCARWGHEVLDGTISSQNHWRWNMGMGPKSLVHKWTRWCTQNRPFPNTICNGNYTNDKYSASKF